MYAIEGDIFDANGVELWSFFRVKSHPSYQVVQSFKYINKQKEKQQKNKSTNHHYHQQKKSHSWTPSFENSHRTLESYKLLEGELNVF